MALKTRSRAADISPGLGLDPTLEDEAILVETRRRHGSRMAAREAGVAGVLNVCFVVACLVVLALAPVHHVDGLGVLLCAVVFVLATRVRIDTPFGYTLATQLAFVPLAMRTPVGLLAPIVMACLILAYVPQFARGEIPVGRLALVSLNAWFSVGPALLFALGGWDPLTAGPAVLIAALAAQFAVDFAVSSIRFGLTRGAPLQAQIRELWVYAVDAGFSGVGWMAGEVGRHRAWTVLLFVPLLGVLALFSREREKRLAATLELSAAYRGTALVLGDVVEADDGYTGEHSKSVVALAAEVGNALGLDAERRRNLEFAALLHDVGKIAVPKTLINKPGRLDAQEWTIVKTHTVEGQRMLDRVGGFMHEVGLIVRSHHERWDGSGYPDGLAGEAIPLEARIVSCCDSWNAMRTDRVYRAALPYATAVAEMKQGAGVQFDPRIVAGLLGLVAEEADKPRAGGNHPSGHSVPTPVT
jgi:putative nucleotidyltransferase with HDIG domain